MSKRNPKWTRDELILALDLYFKYSPLKLNKSSKEVIELSEILNMLSDDIDKTDQDKFRNPNGVYMKLCNFLRLDPSYDGQGLSRGKSSNRKWFLFSALLEMLFDSFNGDFGLNYN